MGKRKAIKTLPKEVTYNKAAGFVSVNKIEQEIEQKLLVLTPFQAYQFSAKHYKDNGFYIASVKDSNDKNEIDVLQQQMRKETFSTRNGNLPVFNTFSNEDPRLIELKRSEKRVDMGRNMIHISATKEKELVKQSVLVGEIIQRMIAEDLHLSLDETKKTQMVLTLLETEGPEKGDPVPDQLMHCDVNTDDSTLDAKDAFIGILACQIGLTEIRVLPRSHVIAKSDSYSVPEYIYRVQLPQYHYLVGHPFLIHGGCGSLHRNTRLHFYHGLSEDSQSKTFFVPWRVSDRTERLKLMRANSKKANKNIVRRREKG